MAIVKNRLVRQNVDSTSDTIHLETSSDLVLRQNGATVESSIETLETGLAGKAPLSHAHTEYASSGHTHTLTSLGAAASSHSHSNYVPTTRTVNGKALSSNITLSASDVGAAASGHTHSGYAPANHTHAASQISGSGIRALTLTSISASYNIGVDHLVLVMQAMGTDANYGEFKIPPYVNIIADNPYELLPGRSYGARGLLLNLSSDGILTFTNYDGTVPSINTTKYGDCTDTSSYKYYGYKIISFAEANGAILLKYKLGYGNSKSESMLESTPMSSRIQFLILYG